jgi:hypothetical protein
MSLPAEFRAFNSNSVWNTPIPADAEVDPDSAAMIAKLESKCSRLKVSVDKWTFPLHVIDASQCPRVDVKTTSEVLFESVDPDGNGIAEGLPIPEGIWADPGGDGHMILADPVLRKSWEFSRARRNDQGVWEASRIDVWDLDGPGCRSPFPGRLWWTSGAIGAGMPLIAGLARPEEIEAGEIRHALLCATPVNRKSVRLGGKRELCPPASRTDAGYIGRRYIPQGARLQLDPALDLETLDLSPAAKVVAKAMQKYGLYVGANCPDFKILFQNLGPDRGKWRHLAVRDDLHKIPVNRFRVLKCAVVTGP